MASDAEDDNFYRYVAYLPDNRSASCDAFRLSKNAEVGDLEKAVLELWKQRNAPYDEGPIFFMCGEDANPKSTRYARVSDWLRKNSENLELNMDFSSDLKDYFPKGPAAKEDKKIDVVIVTRSILETICRPTTSASEVLSTSPETPRKSAAATSELVNRYLDSFGVELKKYLAGLPYDKFWQAASPADAETVKFIDKRKIPLVNGKPELLLHGLGGNMVDQSTINNIFKDENVFLVNTSGSGKTRLLFEGLCRHWGFYFVTHDRTRAPYGSVDLSHAIQQTIPNSSGFIKQPEYLDSRRRDDAYETNHDIAERRVYQVTMARILVFERFLKVARGLCKSGSINKFKKHWLFLQLFSERILSEDVFSRLSTDILRDASDDYLLLGSFKVNAKLVELQKKYGLDEKLFFVLDEAQILVEKLKGKFCSAQNTAVQRPVLKPIISAWSGATVFPKVISGTGLSSDIVNEVTTSAVGKAFEFSLVTKTGAFDDPECQREYILRYMPLHLAESESGKEFLERAWNYARGRHRFTALLMTQLLKLSFKSPHRILNAFVKVFCGFLPSDAERFVIKEEPLTEKLTGVNPFDFSAIRNNTDYVDLFSDVVYTWLLERRFEPLFDNSKELVELGFARFFDDEEKCLVDEPLVLLAAVNEFSTSTRFSFAGYIAKALSKAAGRGENFQTFIGYYLACAFDGQRDLCDIFKFGKDVPEWAKQRAELVSVTWTDQKAEVNHFYLPEFSGSMASIGVNCRTMDETLEWFEDPPSLMCYPDNLMGPDLVTFFRLANGQILVVTIQCKWKSASTLYKSIQAAASVSLDHSRYYARDDVRVDNGTTARENILRRLRQLNGPNFDLEGDEWFQDDVPVLKVIASFPADAHEHPPAYHAMLDMDKCGEVLDRAGFLKRLRESVFKRKRAAESDGDSKSRKRRKWLDDKDS